MYIVPMAWLYVALMMSVAEATNTTGTVLGAAITFVLYGLLPVGLILYFMGTPGRRRAIQKRQEQEQEQEREPEPEPARERERDPQEAHAAALQADSLQPDAGSLPPANPVPPVREIP